MRHLNLPTMLSSDVYSDCVSVIQNANLKERLTDCANLISQAEVEFKSKITTGQIFTISREDVINGNVTAEELKSVYTSQMVGNPIGRKYYDALKLAAPYDLCPFCAHRDVSTLDHYLPKANYPRLSVVPINLVPACRECNTGKLSSYPQNDFEETLHPYFDNIENDNWLRIIINETNPISITFYVQRSNNWSDLLFERVKYHFSSYGLGQLYSVQAARELSGIKLELKEAYNNAQGAGGVKKTLAISAKSRSKFNKNSWQAALYTGLANSEWFCSAGFKNI